MTTLSKLTLFSIIFALIVIIAGAFTRLTNAGLGCPDWPGCYGQLMAPTSPQAQQLAEHQFPESSVDTFKAWVEMSHRYIAGILGLLILSIAIIAWRQRHQLTTSLCLPIALCAIVIFQSMLGMWTVTLKLHPSIVMAHLLGGLLTISLLTWYYLQQKGQKLTQLSAPAWLKRFAFFGLFVLALQIALGGWTSANYAALVCLDFPGCFDSLWPPMNFKEGFNLFLPLQGFYEGGVFDYQARVAIHMMHRYGAAVTAIALTLLSISTLIYARGPLREIAKLLFILLLIQLTLGILNIAWVLPLPIAVAHNAVAVLLLLTTLTISFGLNAKARL